MARSRKSRLLGQAHAGDLNPMWGAVAGGAVGTGAAIGVQTYTGMDKNSELIGMGAGVATGVALMLSSKTRAAGFAAVVTALVTNGFRYAQAMASAKQQIKDITGAGVTFQAKAGNSVKAQLTAVQAAAKAAGFGAVSAQRVPTLGMATAQRVPLMGNLGAVSAQQVPAMNGAGLGIVRPEQVPTLGAPPVTFQGLSSHYGATIFGRE